MSTDEPVEPIVWKQQPLRLGEWDCMELPGNEANDERWADEGDHWVTEIWNGVGGVIHRFLPPGRHSGGYWCGYLLLPYTHPCFELDDLPNWREFPKNGDFLWPHLTRGFRARLRHFSKILDAPKVVRKQMQVDYFGGIQPHYAPDYAKDVKALGVICDHFSHANYTLHPMAAYVTEKEIKRAVEEMMRAAKHGWSQDIDAMDVPDPEGPLTYDDYDDMIAAGQQLVDQMRAEQRKLGKEEGRL